jgi:uncharacterized protein YmfQ (DUF2313 family)
MSQSHKHVLQRLFPLELGGAHEQDMQVEGASLDAAQARAEDLLIEMRPDKTIELLPDWERVYGLTPSADDPISLRHDRLIRKIRERGGLSMPHFIAPAAATGYTVTITEVKPFTPGISCAGDHVYIKEVVFVWRVNVSGTPVYHFSAGISCAGEPLTFWPPATELETLFETLKPAHTYVYFNYSA